MKSHFSKIKQRPFRADVLLAAISLLVWFLLDNWQAASADRRPMCADSGLPRFYVKAGNEARFEGGFVALEKALRSATARATNVAPASHVAPNVAPMTFRLHHLSAGP